MATFDISGLSVYSGTSGIVPFSENQPNIRTLDDTEADTTFEVGDLVTGVTFIGSFEVPLVAGGTLALPMFDNGGEVGFGVPASMAFADFNFPATFDLSTLITTDFVTCFAAGSMISTPDGPRPIEQLEIGDRVLNASDDPVLVRWLGYQKLSPFAHGGTNTSFGSRLARLETRCRVPTCL